MELFGCLPGLQDLFNVCGFIPKYRWIARILYFVSGLGILFMGRLLAMAKDGALPFHWFYKQEEIVCGAMLIEGVTWVVVGESMPVLLFFRPEHWIFFCDYKWKNGKSEYFLRQSCFINIGDFIEIGSIKTISIFKRLVWTGNNTS